MWLFCIFWILLICISIGSGDDALNGTFKAKNYDKSNGITKFDVWDKWSESNTKSQTIIGYYTGTLKWLGDPNDPGFNVQFQVKVVADQSAKVIRVTMEHVNPNCTYNNNIHFYLYTNEGGIECYYPYNCSISFPKDPSSYFNLDVYFPSAGYYWNTIMHFNNFNDAFVLNNAVDGCTNNQLVDVDYPPDTSLFSYCICYNQYKEGGALGCPYNPWNHGGDFLHSTCIPTP